jgi:transposase
MEVLIPCCAGLDVHKKTVEAHVRRGDPDGRLHQATRQWSTLTRDVRAMSDWLAAQGVTHVAMESTGVYWKPIYHILEGRFTVLLVNAQHLKRVPGRKTDVSDCQWIAQLLQHGLLQGSFVPARPQQELRDLTRHRARLVEEHTRTVNRIHKLLEDANLKLGSVATDIMGVSGRAMIEAIIEGEEDARKLAGMAQGPLRGKIPELEKALEGHVTGHHRFLLRLLWKQLTSQEELLAELNTRIEEATRPFVSQQEQLDEVPGIQRRVTEVILAEVGADVTPFPSDAQLASWAGVCPGNEESAGKRRTGRIRPGNGWLRQALVQAAWAASRSRNSYLGAQYRRLAARRGRKRALMAVAHSILVIVYHLLKSGRRYADLGNDFFDRLHAKRLTRYYTKRLEGLGYSVTLEPNTV